jgi:iron complex outermembrane receptor protein
LLRTPVPPLLFREAEAADEAIIVTGSRIRRPYLESTSTVAVIDSQQIQSWRIINTQDLLAKLPQVGILGLIRTNSNFLTSVDGVATLDLRNLGDSPPC